MVMFMVNMTAAWEEVTRLQMTSCEDSLSASAGRAFCEKRHLPPSRLLRSGKSTRLLFGSGVNVVLYCHAFLSLPADIVPSAAVESPHEDV